MTTSIAVIVGIDDYPSQPLTSACKDAVAVRDALVELGLVADSDVDLLTSPPRPDSKLADRNAIIGALKEVYDRGAALDRFFFYFAGHGLTAWTGASKATVSTALVPREAVDLRKDANLLLNVDDLRARMERAGPAEQYFFVDACRDLLFDDHSFDLPGLGWPASDEPRTDPAAQFALFAVSPGGKALAGVGGLGVMSRHLVDAVNGRGLALDWSDDEDSWVVTSESIARHVQWGVEQTLSGHMLWKQRYMIPDPRRSGPPLAPLRKVVSPPRRSFHLEFVPPEVAGWTNVRLRLRGQALQEPCWPPRRAGEAVELDPQVYRLDVETDQDGVTVDPTKVDLRLIDTATIRHAVDVPRPELGPGPADVHIASGQLPFEERARVRAQADEPSAVIELAQLNWPYRQWVAAAALQPWPGGTSPDAWSPRGPILNEQVPPGSYTIRFRLGADVYSAAEFDLVAGQTADIAPKAELTATVSEALPLEHDGSVLLSESIGPLRSSPLLTALPMVGVIPFDTTQNMFSRFRHSLSFPVNVTNIDGLGGSAVRVVVAADGHGWPRPASEVAADVQCEIVTPASGSTPIPMLPFAPGTDGWARLAHGTAAAPTGSFMVRVTSPVLGELELVAAGLPNRVTVVGLAFTPDGRLDVVQHVLRVPGRYYAEEPGIGYSEMLRTLVLGQRLYESDELISHGAVPNAQLLRDLLFAKWTDPVLGCMAYYAWTDAVNRGLPEAQGVAPTNTEITARNLLSYFPQLADAQVIAAHAGLSGTPAAAVPGTDGPQVPVLGRSLREAVRRWPWSAELTRWSSRVTPGSPWTLAWTLPNGTRPADRTQSMVEE